MCIQTFYFYIFLSGFALGFPFHFLKLLFVSEKSSLVFTLMLSFMSGTKRQSGTCLTEASRAVTCSMYYSAKSHEVHSEFFGGEDFRLQLSVKSGVPFTFLTEVFSFSGGINLLNIGIKYKVIVGQEAHMFSRSIGSSVLKVTRWVIFLHCELFCNIHVYLNKMCKQKITKLIC